MENNTSSPQKPQSGSTTKIVTAVLVILAIALISWFLTKKGAQKEHAMSEVKSDSVSEKKGIMSLKDLMGSQNSQKCEASMLLPDGNESVSLTYISGGKMYTENKIKGSQNSSNYFMSDSKDIYSWQQGKKDGIKISLASMEKMSPPDSKNSGMEHQGGAVDLEHKMDYKCEAWNEDKAVFMPPQGIQFMDYGEVMKKIPGAQNYDPSSAQLSPEATQCAACNSLEGEAAAQCKSALKCAN